MVAVLSARSFVDTWLTTGCKNLQSTKQLPNVFIQTHQSRFGHPGRQIKSANLPLIHLNTTHMHGFLNDVFVGLLGLVTIANPITSATVLLALTGRYPEAERNRQIFRATIYVMVVLLICFYAGRAIMGVFGISLPGLRLAGGLIVSYIGFGMLFPPARVAEDDVQAEMAANAPTGDLPDISFIPLTMPCTTGPGTIAFIISAASSIPERDYSYNVHFAVVTIAVLFAFVFWLCLRCATPIMRLLGEKGVDALARIMGFLLVCIGVQFAINGVQDLLKLWGCFTA